MLSGSAFYRIGQIHQALCNDEAITAETLAAEIEVSTRTIKRDIDVMRDCLNVPVEWSASRHSYVLTRPCPTLPFLRMNPREALVLALAGRMSSRLAGSAIGRVFSAMLEKVAPLFGHAVSLRVDVAASVLAPAAAVNDREMEHFFILLEATLDRRAVRMDYPQRNTGRIERRTVHPLLLSDDNDGWLLHAYDPARKALRTFAIGRIRSAMITRVRFTPPPDLDVLERVRNGFGRYSGDEPHTVRIALDKEAAFYAREKAWHHSQQLTERANGGVEITLRVNHTSDVRRTVLAWGRHAQVLEPATLREEIREELRAALDACDERSGRGRGR